MKLRVGLVVSLSVLVVVFTGIIWQVALPRENREYIGRLDEFAEDNEPYFLRLKEVTVYLVRRGDEVIAFDRQNPTHGRCLMFWNTMEGTFIDPCTGSQFRLDGEYKFGPALHDMNRYRVEIVNGEIWVYPDEKIEGEDLVPGRKTSP